MSDIETTDIVVSNRATNFQKADALADHRRRVKFIKVSLDMKDKDMANVKIKDLPDMMEKAQDEITVGKMDQLLEGETIIQSGFLRGVTNFFEGLTSTIPRAKRVR